MEDKNNLVDLILVRANKVKNSKKDVNSTMIERHSLSADDKGKERLDAVFAVLTGTTLDHLIQIYNDPTDYNEAGDAER